MEKAIIGRKIGMSQIFDEAGKVIPVTVIEAGPCVVVQKKTEEKDGYNAVQLGFQDVAERKLTKPEQGHLKKAEVPMKKVLKEFKLNKAAEMNVGDEIKADTFAKGDHIDVTGKIGAVHMGPEQVTVQNLDVVSADPEFNLIAVCGAVPGPKGGIVYLKSTVKTIREKKGEAGTSVNPQKASARANPQKASARNR